MGAFYACGCEEWGATLDALLLCDMLAEHGIVRLCEIVILIATTPTWSCLVMESARDMHAFVTWSSERLMQEYCQGVLRPGDTSLRVWENFIAPGFL